jgi:hypothetical protein
VGLQGLGKKENGMKGCPTSAFKKSTKYEKGKWCIMHDAGIEGVILSAFAVHYFQDEEFSLPQHRKKAKWQDIK